MNCPECNAPAPVCPGKSWPKRAGVTRGRKCRECAAEFKTWQPRGEAETIINGSLTRKEEKPAPASGLRRKPTSPQKLLQWRRALVANALARAQIRAGEGDGVI